MWTLAALLALGFLLAGCTGPSATQPDSAPDASDGATDVDTDVDAVLLEASFGWAAGTGVPVTDGYVHLAAEGDVAVLPVSHDVVVRGEAQWTCQAGPCELELVLKRDGATVLSLRGPSPLSFEEPLPAGDHRLQLVNRSPNQGVSGTVLVRA